MPSNFGRMTHDFFTHACGMILRRLVLFRLPPAAGSSRIIDLPAQPAPPASAAGPRAPPPPSPAASPAAPAPPARAARRRPPPRARPSLCAGPRRHAPSRSSRTSRDPSGISTKFNIKFTCTAVPFSFIWRIHNKGQKIAARSNSAAALASAPSKPCASSVVRTVSTARMYRLLLACGAASATTFATYFGAGSWQSGPARSGRLLEHG